MQVVQEALQVVQEDELGDLSSEEIEMERAMQVTCWTSVLCERWSRRAAQACTAASSAYSSSSQQWLAVKSQKPEKKNIVRKV